MTDSKKEPQFKELLRTFNQADIVFIKSLLNDEGILYYINNEHVDMVGMLSFAEPMRVMVEDDGFEQAKEILAEFKGQFIKLSDLDD
ncbi:MAG: DUF2007 domain-containing protein [Candidatus Omnitrophica bacterium]|nr:DUF2007 domain-containing protein [Candidatus Omnitrophota bacterium]